MIAATYMQQMAGGGGLMVCCGETEDMMLTFKFHFSWWRKVLKSSNLVTLMNHLISSPSLASFCCHPMIHRMKHMNRSGSQNALKNRQPLLVMSTQPARPAREIVYLCTHSRPAPTLKQKLIIT